MPVAVSETRNLETQSVCPCRSPSWVGYPPHHNHTGGTDGWGSSRAQAAETRPAKQQSLAECVAHVPALTGS